jgi:hypothetical protein
MASPEKFPEPALYRRRLAGDTIQGQATPEKCRKSMSFPGRADLDSRVGRPLIIAVPDR